MADTTYDRADWQPSPQPEDSVISAEHLGLVDFAQRLGSSATNDEPGIADVTQDADLLMSLLSSPPHVVSDEGEHSSFPGVSAGYVNDHHYMSDASTSSATTTSTQHRRESFRFSHPSLSLDRKRKTLPFGKLRTPCTAPDKEDEIEEIEMPPPAVLLGRALKVDDREAHRLSADAMARNLMQSFQKAIVWRTQAWMEALSASLVRQEKELLRRNATEEELKALLRTSEARLFLRLRQVSKAIEVKRAETCFHVLPQRTERQQQEEEPEGSLVKRRRIESEDSELRMGETEYQYTVCHALEFDGTIHLKTPAGNSEISLEVPGFIEGTFLSSEPGMEDLTAVEVEIDTNILSSMVEKSCRIIVRSSIEHICRQEAPHVSSKAEASKEASSERAEASSPYPRFQRTTVIGESECPSDVAVVTPRAKAPQFVAGGEPISLQIPDDLDGRQPRRISPQPHMPDVAGMHFTPSTPSPSESKPLPCMVSPAPKAEGFQETGFKLAKRGRKGKNGPNLPVLVEVACAAMHAKAGLTTGQ